MGRIVLGVQEGVLELKVPLKGPYSLYKAFAQLRNHRDAVAKLSKWPIEPFVTEALALYDVAEQRVQNTAHRLGLTIDFDQINRDKRALTAVLPIITIAGQFLYKGLGILTANINPISLFTSIITNGVLTNFKIDKIFMGLFYRFEFH